MAGWQELWRRRLTLTAVAALLLCQARPTQTADLLQACKAVRGKHRQAKVLFKQQKCGALPDTVR